ncbi:MAG: LysR family transcriptional regulator [Candidatus Ruminococcus intestinipullorum]|nr:LysR family transcriptional regulator [Candidatus Ruminococcus intestinipullorum]
MEMKEFIYLITLEEEGNISRAAERLYMAQSSLSQFLQQFETELGVKLFVRTPKGIHPTHNGERFIEHARSMLLQYQRAKNEIWSNENLEAGKISFGISTFRGQRMLPKILKGFHDKYPKVHVEVVEENSMRLEELLVGGKLDLAIVVMPTTKLKKEVSVFRKDEILLVVHKDHPLVQHIHPTQEQGKYWVSLKDTVQYEYILSGYDTILGSLGRDMLRKQKLKWRAFHNNISAPMAVAMAKEGLGLAFTYQSCVEESDDVLYLRIGKEGVFLDLGIAYPPGEYRSKGAEELEKIVRQVYEEN